MQTNYDVIVIGGGPAGCSAAAFVSRSKWSTLVVDKSIDAGFLGSLGNVSYFPGFPEAIRGRDILERMKRQAELVGSHWSSDAVTSVDGMPGAFKIVTRAGKAFEARALVVASGASDRTSYLQGEREFMGKGVSHDVLADGPAVAKRNAAVIGKTAHAVQEAIALARFAEHIDFIIPSSKLEVPDELLNRLRETKSIEAHFSASLKRINGTDHVNSITVFIGGQERELPAVGVFTYVHEYKAATDFLGGFVEIAQLGAIKVDEQLSTSVEGVFACGDVLCGKPQMPAISAAQGLLAGVGANAYLASRNT